MVHINAVLGSAADETGRDSAAMGQLRRAHGTDSSHIARHVQPCFLAPVVLRSPPVHIEDHCLRERERERSSHISARRFACHLHGQWRSAFQYCCDWQWCHARLGHAAAARPSHDLEAPPDGEDIGARAMWPMSAAASGASSRSMPGVLSCARCAFFILAHGGRSARRRAIGKSTCRSAMSLRRRVYAGRLVARGRLESIACER